MNSSIKKSIKKADKCHSILSKIKGFMFSFSKNPKLFIFNQEQQVQVHTFFCFFPLKIIYLDKNLKVVRQEIVKPFRILKPFKAKYILEIPYKK